MLFPFSSGPLKVILGKIVHFFRAWNQNFFSHCRLPDGFIPLPQPLHAPAMFQQSRGARKLAGRSQSLPAGRGAISSHLPRFVLPHRVRNRDIGRWVSRFPRPFTTEKRHRVARSRGSVAPPRHFSCSVTPATQRIPAACLAVDPTRALGSSQIVFD